MGGLQANDIKLEARVSTREELHHVMLVQNRIEESS